MIDKILSFVFMLCLWMSSVFGLPLSGYESRDLFKDSSFSNGFTVISQQAANNAGVPLGSFTYGENEELPSWMIAQWNSGPCLWNDRVESDRYTITDGLTKFVTFNPEEKSVSMRLNAANIYSGEAAGEYSWPHLLLEQSPLCDYNSMTETEKAFYSCSADRIVLSLDIRVTDFKPTTNTQGINAAQYLAYFYLNGVSQKEFIWFGVNLFDDRGYQDTYWALDEASNKMIYCVSTQDTFGGKNKSLYRNGETYISEDWVHVELDLSPHIAKAIKEANKSDTFGYEVSVEDFYIGGTNIGFEIHGNYDCTVEIKNFQLTSYNRK
ncbi:MAG: hypothetical protein IKK37_05285 [Clostridia bacterium]|nr:hypothetical protein [Clostridia bacterium]